MKSPNKIAATVALIIIAMLGAACGSGTGSGGASPGDEASRSPNGGAQEEAGPGVTEDTIRIGYLAPLSGDFASYGEPNFKFFQHEIEQLNADGGVAGRQIEIVREDSQCAPDAGVRGARNLLSADVLMHFGYVCSGVAAAAREVMRGTGVPVIVSSASGPDPEQNDPNIFYITVSTYRQGRALVSYAAEELGAERIALIRASDAYGELSHQGIAEYIDEEGLELVANEVADRDATDVSAQLATIEDSDPDVVLMATYANIAALYLRQSHEQGFTPPTLGMAATEQAIDLAQDKSNLDNFYTLTAFGDVFEGENMGPYADEFRNAYPEYEDQPIPQFTFLGITEAALLEEVISRIEGAITQPAVIESLDSITDWQPDAPTLACPLDFSSESNEGEMCATIVKVEDGQRVVVGPADGS